MILEALAILCLGVHRDRPLMSQYLPLEHHDMGLTYDENRMTPHESMNRAETLYNRTGYLTNSVAN